MNLVGGYANIPIIKGIDLEVKKGEFFALLGPNGSGKTTLFKLITGQLPIQHGEIKIDGKEISTITKLEKAKKVAVLSQEIRISFDYTVEEIISLGRYPHQKGIFKILSKYDRDVIKHVMEVTKVVQFRTTEFRVLSGGEKQRVLLAKALAQEPEILLLDEPTNHLDIKHTFQLLNLLKEWQRTKGLTIFSILHDLNVASLYADRIALLHEGEFLEVGDVHTLRKEDQLKKVYEVDVKTQSHPNVPKPQLLMTPNHSAMADIKAFNDSFEIEQKADDVFIEFDQPLRTLSNRANAGGIQWVQRFCFTKTNVDSKENRYDPLVQTIKLEVKGSLENNVAIYEEFGLMAIVAIEKKDNGTHSINTMVFIEGKVTDSFLLSGCMSATEAKMKAIRDVGILGSVIDTSNDHLSISVRQQGTNKKGMDESTVRKEIEQLVYRATKQVLHKQGNRVAF
ncbi:ATP-binding cassette domain-containing protein [bacterium LRH843]|nr:ATP-binding cassette domain-containing protein [bacterium LRH843]